MSILIGVTTLSLEAMIRGMTRGWVRIGRDIHYHIVCGISRARRIIVCHINQACSWHVFETSHTTFAALRHIPSSASIPPVFR